MIPDYFDAITAYRAFNVFETGLLAGSRFEPWPPCEPFAARCGGTLLVGAGEHVRDGRFVAAPVYGCSCGIYALKASEAALERALMDRRELAIWLPQLKIPARLMSLPQLKPPAGVAWGAVKIWGRVIEHESGYRAEFAYPFDLHCDDANLAPRVAALYGVRCDYTPLEDPDVPSSRDENTSANVDYNTWPLFSYEARQEFVMAGLAALLTVLPLTLQSTAATSQHCGIAVMAALLAFLFLTRQSNS